MCSADLGPVWCTIPSQQMDYRTMTSLKVLQDPVTDVKMGQQTSPHTVTVDLISSDKDHVHNGPTLIEQCATFTGEQDHLQ